MITRDNRVWISVEQRLDGLTSRWGPDPYLTLHLEEGSGADLKIHEFDIDQATAKLLARGINKALKRAVAP